MCNVVELGSRRPGVALRSQTGVGQFGQILPHTANIVHRSPLQMPLAHSLRLAAAALVEPLRGIRPSGGPLARSFVRALAEQPMRQLAVERLLREGGFVEEVAAQICAAAEALRDDDHAHAMRERVRRIDQGA